MNDSLPPNKQEETEFYRAYLLRMWCPEHEESGCWSASLENSQTGERVGFASLEELFEFLMQVSEQPRKTVPPNQMEREG